MTTQIQYEHRDAIEQARRPEVAAAFRALRDAVLSRDSLIPYPMKREIFTISSIAAGCTHCQAHGSYSLHEEGVDDARIQALWDFERSPLFSDGERAAYRFGRDASLAPNATTPEHHARPSRRPWRRSAHRHPAKFLGLRWNKTTGAERGRPGAARPP